VRDSRQMQGRKRARTAGAFRVLYVAKFDDAVYVLHCFQKKTQKTSKANLNLAAQHYRDLLKELGNEQETLRQYVGCN
jgi:phage-related protein